tara:strand:+ start:1967 stop:4240 length:2274 start_codon:yes stop_codon:yes gene_type:complete
MAAPWEKYGAPAESAAQSGPWSKYGGEGMPVERKPLTMGESFMQIPTGVYKGFKDVTDTLFKGGASAVDFVTGANTRAAIDAAAAQSNADYERTYGGSNLAATGRLAGNIGATFPVGGALAAPFRTIAPEAAVALQTGGFGAKTLAGRGTAGAVTGAVSAGLVNPEDAGTGAIVGAVVPTVVAPLVKGGAKLIAKTSDLFSGNTAKVKAAEIARETLGDQIQPALIALANADPARKLTPAQILKEAGIKAEPFMALEALAKNKDVKGFYSTLEELATLGQQNQLARLAGGNTQTEIAESLKLNKNALTARTTPMMTTELQAANQANQVRQRLEPTLAQKEASMIDALQGQGQAATNAAQQANLARGGVIPSTMGTAPNTLPSPLGGTGVPQPVSGVVPGMPRLSPSITLNAERATESGVLSTEMAAIKAQRQAERDFLQRQIGSLEAYGLKPLDINPIINTIDSKLADPNLYGQTQLLNVLRGLRDDFTGAVSANGGVADARALYSMRKAGISQKIDEMYGSLDPSAKQRLTADVLASVKAPIDEAITAAGGTGWNRYLQTFETGMQQLDQQKLAAIALDRFKGDKAGFLKLVRGDDTDAVEKVFGYGSANIFKEMGRDSAVLQNIGRELERDIAVQAQAKAGMGGLSGIMTKDQSTLRRVANIIGRGGRAAELTLEQLEGKVDKKVIDLLREGFKSNKDLLQMMSALPKEETSGLLKALKETKQWNASVNRGGSQLFIDRTNQLAPPSENRNNLRP